MLASRKFAARGLGWRAAGVAALMAGFGTGASAAVVTVMGTADPYLAGMPDGATNGSDSAPAHSPVLVGGLDLGLGGWLTFTGATGGVSNAGGCSLNPPFNGCSPIDGATFFTHAGGAVNGISNVHAPINALVGVFLGPGQPSLNPAPAALDFQALGVDFATLAPLLQQVFFIGDGMNASAQVQQFVVPTGATRLYLGTMDGFGWFNNSGAITVEVTHFATAVPEPSSLAMLLGGVAVLVGARRRASAAKP